MASKRLTGSLRDKIINNAVSAAFDARMTALDEVEHALALDIYNDTVGKHADILKTMPPMFFNKDDDFRVGLGKTSSGDSNVVTIKLSEYMPIWNNTYMAHNHYGNTHKFTKRWDKLSADRKEFWNERIKFEKDLRGALLSVTTVKRLVETLPDIEQYLPEEALAESITTLPAVLCESLGKVLRQGTAQATA